MPAHRETLDSKEHRSAKRVAVECRAVSSRTIPADRLSRSRCA